MPKLGAMLNIESTRGPVAARVIALSREDDSFYIGWKTRDSAHPDAEGDVFTGDEDDRTEWRLVSNVTDYEWTMRSDDVTVIEETREAKMKKVLGNLKSEAGDAAWRQSVEQAIGLGHAHAVKHLTGIMGSTKAKALGQFFGSNEGKHVLAFALGVGLEAIPLDDERLERLAKELRVFGLEVIAAPIIKAVAIFAKDVTGILPTLPKKMTTGGKSKTNGVSAEA